MPKERLADISIARWTMLAGSGTLNETNDENGAGFWLVEGDGNATRRKRRMR